MARNHNPADNNPAATAPAVSASSNPHAGGMPVMTSGLPGGASGQPTTAMPQLVSQSEVIGTAMRPGMPGSENVPKAKKYRVLNGGMITWRGNRTPMKAGKIIDSVQYDIPSLRSQGIKMEEVTEENSLEV
jgi:hypothetical protein